MAFSPAQFSRSRRRISLYGDDKENNWAEYPSPQSASRLKAEQRDLPDLQLSPLRLPMTEVDNTFTGDIEVTPVPVKMTRKRKSSLGRRVSFAENLTIHEFPRDEEYITPPDVKDNVGEHNEVADSNGKQLAGGAILFENEEETRGLPGQGTATAAVSSVLSTSAFPSSAIEGSEEGVLNVLRLNELKLTLPSPHEGDHIRGKTMSSQAIGMSSELKTSREKDDHTEDGLLQSARQMHLYISPMSSEKADDLENTGPVDMRFLHRLQELGDDQLNEDDTMAMDVTFSAHGEITRMVPRIDQLLAADGEDVTAFPHSSHAQFGLPGTPAALPGRGQQAAVDLGALQQKHPVAWGTTARGDRDSAQKLCRVQLTTGPATDAENCEVGDMSMTAVVSARVFKAAVEAEHIPLQHTISSPDGSTANLGPTYAAGSSNSRAAHTIGRSRGNTGNQDECVANLEPSHKSDQVATCAIETRSLKNQPGQVSGKHGRDNAVEEPWQTGKMLSAAEIAAHETNGENPVLHKGLQKEHEGQLIIRNGHRQPMQVLKLGQVAAGNQEQSPSAIEILRLLPVPALDDITTKFSPSFEGLQKAELASEVQENGGRASLGGGLQSPLPRDSMTHPSKQNGDQPTGTLSDTLHELLQPLDENTADFALEMTAGTITAAVPRLSALLAADAPMTETTVDFRHALLLAGGEQFVNQALSVANFQEPEPKTDELDIVFRTSEATAQPGNGNRLAPPLIMEAEISMVTEIKSSSEVKPSRQGRFNVGTTVDERQFEFGLPTSLNEKDNTVSFPIPKTSYRSTLARSSLQNGRNRRNSTAKRLRSPGGGKSRDPASVNRLRNSGLEGRGSMRGQGLIAVEDLAAWSWGANKIARTEELVPTAAPANLLSLPNAGYPVASTNGQTKDSDEKEPSAAAKLKAKATPEDHSEATRNRLRQESPVGSDVGSERRALFRDTPPLKTASDLSEVEDHFGITHTVQGESPDNFAETSSRGKAIFGEASALRTNSLVASLEVRASPSAKGVMEASSCAAQHLETGDNNKESGMPHHGVSVLDHGRLNTVEARTPFAIHHPPPPECTPSESQRQIAALASPAASSPGTGSTDMKAKLAKLKANVARMVKPKSYSLMADQLTGDPSSLMLSSNELQQSITRSAGKSKRPNQEAKHPSGTPGAFSGPGENAVLDTLDHNGESNSQSTELDAARESVPGSACQPTAGKNHRKEKAPLAGVADSSDQVESYGSPVEGLVNMGKAQWGPPSRAPANSALSSPLPASAKKILEESSQLAQVQMAAEELNSSNEALTIGGTSLPKHNSQGPRGIELEAMQKQLQELYNTWSLAGKKGTVSLAATHLQQQVPDCERSLASHEERSGTVKSFTKKIDGLASGCEKLLSGNTAEQAAREESHDDLANSRDQQQQQEMEQGMGSLWAQKLSGTRARMQQKLEQLRRLKEQAKKVKEDAEVFEHTAVPTETHQPAQETKMDDGNLKEGVPRSEAETAAEADEEADIITTSEKMLKQLSNLQGWRLQHSEPDDSATGAVMDFDLEGLIQLRLALEQDGSHLSCRCATEMSGDAVEKAFPHLGATALLGPVLQAIPGQADAIEISQILQEVNLVIDRALDILRELEDCRYTFPYLAFVRCTSEAEGHGVVVHLTFLHIMEEVKFVVHAHIISLSRHGPIFANPPLRIDLVHGGKSNTCYMDQLEAVAPSNKEGPRWFENLCTGFHELLEEWSPASRTEYY